MANPWHHAVSSARKWGGVPEDYLPVHEWFDETKAWCPDFRHRAIRHHSEGIFEAMQVFGTTITIFVTKNGESGVAREKHIPVRWIGEQHVQEDLGHIPTAADWLRRISAEPWMNRSRRLSRELAEM